MKTMRIVLVALAALGTAFPVSAHEGAHGKAAAHAPKVAAGAKSLSLKLSGLHCGGCALSVRGKLMQIPGVSDAAVDAKTQSATVKLARGAKRPSDAALKAAVKAAGYTCAAVKG